MPANMKVNENGKNNERTIISHRLLTTKAKSLGGNTIVGGGIGVLLNLATNMISELPYLYILLIVLPLVVIIIIIGAVFQSDSRKRGRFSKLIKKRWEIIERKSSLQRVSDLWCILASLIVVWIGANYCFTCLYEKISHTVYYENYVLNYGLPMGTGQSTNKCVGGWYKFEFKGTHKFSNDALCLYGENRRYRFLCFNRYRTLRRVTQVNALEQPLWFSENLDADGAKSRMEFIYASSDQLRQKGATPIRLQVFMKTPNVANRFSTLYVENYSDRWGGTNDFVSLTWCDSRERYYLAGASLNWSKAFPGRSNVSQYTVKWDEEGRRSEVIFESDCDLEGVSRLTYAYREDTLGDGASFVYPYEVRMYRKVGPREDMCQKVVRLWNGLIMRENVMQKDVGRDDTCYYQHIFHCQYRNTATVLRTEMIDTTDQFEPIEDVDSHNYAVEVRAYDKYFNCTQMLYFANKECSKPFMGKDDHVARWQYSWATNGLLSSVETFDETGRPIPGISYGVDRVSKIVYGYEDNLYPQLYRGTNSVLPTLTSLPFGSQISLGDVVDLQQVEYDSNKWERVLEILIVPRGGAKECLKIRNVYYKENPDGGRFPYGKMARLECLSQDGTLSTNAVSSYFTYRHGVLCAIENKRGIFVNGKVEPDKSDYFQDKEGMSLSAISRFEYDSLNRPVRDLHLDRSGGTNSLPKDMVYEVRYEYEGNKMKPCRQVWISGTGVITNDLTEYETAN